MAWMEFITSYSDVVWAAVLLAAALIAAKAIDFTINRGVKRVAAKTKTMLDDMIIHAIHRPIYIGALLFGAYLALSALRIVSPYANILNQAFTVVFILFGAYVAVKVINAFIQWYAEEIAVKTKTKADEQFLPIFRKIAYALVFILAFLWILNQFGIEITTLVAALGIGGLAIALGLQDTLKEFFAGAYIIADRPIRIGDYIELDSGQKGYVEDIGWRSTKIRMLGNNLVVVPNSKMASSIITNYYAPVEEMSVVVPVGVGYQSDLDKVERITIDVAKQVLKKEEGAVKDFKPFIRYKEFGDSNINFSVILRVKKYVDKYRVTHEFIKALKKRYDKEGIEIAWPIRKLYFAKKKVD